MTAVYRFSPDEERVASLLGDIICEQADSGDIKPEIICVVLARISGAILSAAGIDGETREALLKLMLEEARTVGRESDAVRGHVVTEKGVEAGHA